ncbi:exp1-like protein [Mortierella sp. NVP85]|nr:exp1-like protein [Mortierella sp. NVP85]
MATKAAGAAAATKKPKVKAEAEKTTKPKATKATKATKTTKTTKAAGETKPKAKKAVKPKEKKPKIKPLDMPKRPATAWTLFFKDHLDEVRASGKPFTPTKETVVASALWQQLPSVQKQAYEDKFKVAYEQYKKDLDQRLQELTPEEYKLENARRQALRAAGKKSLPRLKDPNAPKRPLSSYFRFAQDLRQSGKYAKLPLKEQAKAFASAWASAPKAEKERYQELSRVAIEKYKDEKAAYQGKD